MLYSDYSITIDVRHRTHTFAVAHASCLHQAKNSSTGETFSNYTFGQAVVMDLWYNVEGLAPAGGTGVDVEPALLVYEPGLGKWVDAASTCDPPYSEVNHVLRRLRVSHVVHMHT